MFLKRYLHQFNQYLAMQHYSETTIEGYKQHIKPFIKYIEATDITDIQSITKEALLQYQMSLIAGDNVSAVETQCSRIKVVKALFRYLSKTNQIMYDPASDLELPKRKRSLPKGILTVKEMKKILNQPDVDDVLGLRDKSILEMLYATGIRNREIRKLKIQDIDLSEQMIKIVEGKGGKERMVPLGSITANYLDEYIRYGRPQLVGTKDQKVLFVTKNGNEINHSSLINLVKKYVKRAKIKKNITPHSFRHTCATHLLKNRASLRHIQELLGHESIETTQIYLQVTQVDLRKEHRKYHPRERG